MAPNHAVTTTATYTVQCADSSSLSKIPSPMTLGALDQQVFPIVPVAVVFIYDADPSTSPSSPAIPIPKLKAALSHLLDHYPHLTGRLSIHPTTGTRSIDRLGLGIHLHAATCDATLASLSPSGRLTLPDLPDGGNALLAPYEPTVDAVCGDRTPILSVQHTAFACGAVALGLRALHTVVDSDAFFQIARDLAAIYRSLSSSSGAGEDAPAAAIDPPPLAAYLAETMEDGGMTDAERAEALAFEPTLFSVEAGGKEAVPERYAQKATPPPPAVEGRVMRFTAEQLTRLKAAAAEDAADGENGWVSTYDALSALVWTRVHRARVELRRREGGKGEDDDDDDDDEQLPSRDFLTSVNYRARLALPARYPYNAVLAPYTRLPHAELLADASLRAAARTVHALTRSVGADEARRTARWMAAQPDRRGVKWGFDGGYGSTMISAWNKFDVYAGTAFEEGRPPVLVAPPFTPISLVDGLGYYLPTEGRGGGIDLYLALSAPVWGVLEGDGVWRRFRE